MTLKRLMLGLVFSGCLVAAGDSVTIPKGATPNADDTYTWKDRDGKTWTYTHTPFGISRTLTNDPHPKKALPKGVPAGAKANQDGTWTWTDKAGEKWTYRITPFGVARTSAEAQQAAGVKVTDKGDTVLFEQTTPFGHSVIERKKTDLTDDERRLLEQQTEPAKATQ